MRDPTAGILVLLLGIFLLTSYFAGRLDWLFSLKNQVKTAATSGSTSPSATSATSAKLGGAPLALPRLAPPTLRSVV